MYTLSNLYRTNCSLLISACILLPLLTNNVVAITAAATTTNANGIPAITNYHQNSNYKDAAAAAAIAVTAAMTAAALPVAVTAKDYSQQLPQHYPITSASSAAVDRHDVGGVGGSVSNANMPAEQPLYQKYFENGDVDGIKIGSMTVITRDQNAKWRMSAGNDGRAATGTADEAAMTIAGFVPTTITAAGQHYVAGNYAAHNGDEANNGEGGISADSGSYAYVPPEGKIDYEINEDNYKRKADNGRANADGDVTADDGSGSTNMGAVNTYDMYKYDMNEYAKEMQRAIASSAAGNTEGRYDEASTDVDSSNHEGGSYFENRLAGLENYFMPTYQIEQFSNYHNQEERAPTEQQIEELQKSNHGLHEQPQLRPLALFVDGGGGGGGGGGGIGNDNNVMLQQFNNGAYIENYANDRKKLRYYAKQPSQPQRERQHQQQQQKQQQLKEQQQQLKEQQQHQQQQQIKEQHQHQQQQQLQLSHQFREYPEMQQFSLQHQHLPHTQHQLAPLTLIKANRQRPNDKMPLSARSRQQHQLQHQKRDAVSLQVIGNVARRRLLPTSGRSFHIDSDSRSRGSSNEKSSISENIVDSTNSPSQFHYTLTQPSHVSQLVDDSVNEIDDTHNNIDDNGNSIDVSSATNTNQYFVTTSHKQHKETVPFKQQHNDSLVGQYTLPPITTTIRHTPASSAALAGIPLSRHVEVTKHIPVITDYQRIHVPYNQSVPIHIPQPIVTAIPRPYVIRVPVTKTVAVPKVQEVRIPVDKVKTFPVERPVPYLVERRVPYMIEKQVAKPIYYPYPVQVPIVKTIVHKVPRRPHNYVTYQQHSSSHPFTLNQYHLQQQHTIAPHLLNSLHYTQHLG